MISLRIKMLLVTVVLISSCGGLLEENRNKSKSNSDESSSGENDQNKEETSGETPKPRGIKRSPCKLTSNAVPLKIDMTSVVEIINALPKPVTIPCVLDVLPRPLNLNASSSSLSVQPALGSDNPRVFIEIDGFLISFALAGEGAKALEFSELISNSRSIKGEIAFPVEKDLSETAAMDQILRSSGEGTRCTACHMNETIMDEDAEYPIFTTRALRPFERQNVTIEELNVLQKNCFDEESLRCQMLDSLFLNSVQPTSYEFPESMSTLF